MRMRHLLAAALVLTGAAASAHAGFIDTVILGQNTYQDLSREQIAYQKGTSGLQVGDVVFGFIQIQSNTTPGGPALTQNTLYLAYSLQVTSITNSGTVVNFGPTAAANANSLQTLLGKPTLDAGTVAIVYDRLNTSPFGVNLVTTNPPPGATATMQDYLKYLNSNGTLEFTAGFKGTNPDFFNTTLGVVAGTQLTASTATPTVLNGLSNGITFGTNTGGLSVILNNTGLPFAALNVSNDGNLHDVSIQQASVAGGKNLANFNNWGQPGTNTAGVSNNASFSVWIVPEPTSIALVGMACGGLLAGGLVRKLRKKAVVA